MAFREHVNRSVGVKVKMDYKIVKIPKKNGFYREICIVDDNTKKELKKLLPVLEKRHLKLDKLKANYAFIKGRNCVLNALQHVGYNFTLSLDLENFFDSVTPIHLQRLVEPSLLRKCLIEGSPKQGLPTSPLLASIAFTPYDEKIHSILQNLKIPAVYTRYADDLTFSFNKKEYSGQIQFTVGQVLASSGFLINNRKTKLQNLKNGRIIITGIGIDKNGLHPTRKTRKKIRAATHQRNLDSLRGLLEWEKCKLPKSVIG